jgi:hypothetical protein
MLNREDWLIELVKRDLEKEFVSHYTNLETTVFDIIPSNKIKFSTQEENNDPHEYKKDLGVLILGKENDKDFYWKGEEFLEHNVKVFSTSVSSKKRVDPKYTPITDCSFGNVMMWAQYGNNHKGAVLLFDKSDLEEEVKNQYEMCFIEKVDYDNISKLNFSVSYDSKRSFRDNIYNELKKDKKNRFFIKQKEWSHEKEMRWVILNERKKGSEFLDYKKSLKAVILGDRTEKRHIEVVKRLLEGTKIEIYELVWDQIDEKSFKLNKIKPSF